MVGIQIEAGTMYTGTLIRDLMATVERVERRVQKQFGDEKELQAFFELQVPGMQEEPIFVGAA